MQNRVKCNETSMDWCNSLGLPRQTFLTLVVRAHHQTRELGRGRDSRMGSVKTLGSERERGFHDPCPPQGGGGPFSAQSADLHCVWMCKKLVSSLRDMGDMAVTDTGIVQWTLRTGDIVALQQFHDNLMVASKGPMPRGAMFTVCKTMESIWGLKVLCPCRDKNPDLVCHGECMSSTVRCMGVSIFVSPSCTLAHANPNALNTVWQLKFGAPPQSFWATTAR